MFPSVKELGWYSECYPDHAYYADKRRKVPGLTFAPSPNNTIKTLTADTQHMEGGVCQIFDEKVSKLGKIEIGYLGIADTVATLMENSVKNNANAPMLLSAEMVFTYFEDAQFQEDPTQMEAFGPIFVLHCSHNCPNSNDDIKWLASQGNGSIKKCFC